MANPDDISIQISLYPLGDTDITKAIFELLNIFQHYGLDYKLGSMSTVISGDTGTVFQALEEAYRHTANAQKFVLVCTMSNAVPTDKDMEDLDRNMPM